MSFVLNIPLNAHPNVLKALADFVGKVAEHNQNPNPLAEPPNIGDMPGSHEVYTDPETGLGTTKEGEPLPEIPAHAHLPVIEESVYPSEASNVSSDELDSTGLPWDPRIHSRTKSKRPTGEWKLQRGISPTIVQQVMMELRGTAAVAPPPPVAAPATTAKPVTAPPPPPSATTDPFADFVCRIMKFIPTGRLTRQALTEVLNRFGFNDLPAVKVAPELIPTLEKAIMEVVQ